MVVEIAHITVVVNVRLKKPVSIVEIVKMNVMRRIMSVINVGKHGKLMK